MCQNSQPLKLQSAFCCWEWQWNWLYASLCIYILYYIITYIKKYIYIIYTHYNIYIYYTHVDLTCPWFRSAIYYCNDLFHFPFLPQKFVYNVCVTVLMPASLEHQDWTPSWTICTLSSSSHQQSTSARDYGRQQNPTALYRKIGQNFRAEGKNPSLVLLHA